MDGGALMVVSDPNAEARIREALDLGLQAWRTTPVREKFHAALAALDELVARLREAVKERDEAQRETRLEYEARREVEQETQQALGRLREARDNWHASAVKDRQRAEAAEKALRWIADRQDDSRKPYEIARDALEAR